VIDPVRISRLGARLARLLAPEECAAFQHELESAGSDRAFDVLDRVADRLAHLLAGLRESGAAFAERTLQLELALGVLRERDKAAAEQSEWDFAADLQTAGLPNDFPAYPDRRDFDVYAGMVTAKEVGGDLYDFFLLGPGRFAFVVADAAGKGLPAAIFITLTRTLLRAAAARIEAPGDCMRIVNAMLCVDNPTLMFTTGFFGVLDTSSGELQYANAGHNPPYVVRKGGAIELVPSQGAMALGIMEESRYATGTLRLAPGESLVCFSDGVTEALDRNGALFGEERLVATLAAKAGAVPAEIAAQIVADVDLFIGTAAMADDITVLTVAYYGAA
jgi:sigma-B regulation protein RsbU (phosphoserine phosphatase)